MTRVKAFTTFCCFAWQNGAGGEEREAPSLGGLLLTCGFAVRFLAVGTVIYVDVWSVIFIHLNAAETTGGKKKSLMRQM